MDLWPLGVYAALVALLVTAMLGLSYVLGQRHHDRSTDSPYESGILSEGSARVRLSAKFYLVAMFFVIFDLEAVFLIAWAIAFRELGWVGYIEVVVFIGILAGIGFFDLGQEAYTLAALLLGIGALLDYGRKRTAGRRSA